MVTSVKKLVSRNGQVCKHIRIDKEASEQDLPVMFDDHLKHVQERNSFFSKQEKLSDLRSLPAETEVLLLKATGDSATAT
jgi:hypothetical protein